MEEVREKTKYWAVLWASVSPIFGNTSLSTILLDWAAVSSLGLFFS